MSHRINTEVEVALDIDCSQCGTTLVVEGRDTDLSIHPCPTCLSEAKKASHDEGYEAGLEDGREESTGAKS